MNSDNMLKWTFNIGARAARVVSAAYRPQCHCHCHGWRDRKLDLSFRLRARPDVRQIQPDRHGQYRDGSALGNKSLTDWCPAGRNRTGTDGRYRDG